MSRAKFSLSGAAAYLIDSVQINQTSEVEQDGRVWLLKRRRAGRGAIIYFGNLFLKYSRSRIVMFPRTLDWQSWETHSFGLLHGQCYQSRRFGNDAVLLERLQGNSLKSHLKEKTLTLNMLSAAGQEFRRAHQLFSTMMNGAWSHGDPHLDNVLYHHGQAYFIDFETRHEQGLSETECHADDLLVLLLDLLGRDLTPDWLDRSQTFLLAYDDPAVWQHLTQRLVLPHSLERVLWKARTAYLDTATLNERLQELRQMIDGLPC